jgi:hypothetical protein
MEPLHLSPNNLEAQITALFAPWLVEDVPEEKWATLQEKLDRIVRGIISGKNPLQGGQADLPPLSPKRCTKPKKRA